MPLYMYCILFAGFEVKYKMKNAEKNALNLFENTCILQYFTTAPIPKQYSR